MNASNTHTSREPRRSRRATVLLLSFTALVAAGLYVWSSMLQTVRYELAVEPPTLFTGAPDSVRIRAWAVNRWDGRIPFSDPAIRVELLEGSELGSLAQRGGDHAWVFISNGLQGGTAVFRVFVDDWPFPMMAVVRIAAPVAAEYYHLQRRDV